MNILRRTFMGRPAFIAIAFILGGTPLVAQQVRPSPGKRVRVQVAGESGGRIFTLKEVIADTLVLEGLNEGTQETRIPVTSVSRLQVSEGYRSAGSRALRGAGYGLGSGVMAGAIIGLASGDDEYAGTFFALTAGEKAFVGGVLLGTAGIVIGTVTGLAHNPERWKTLSRVAVAPNTNGALVIGFHGVF